MSVELLVEAFAGWGKDNPANMRDVLHPDRELVVPDSIPYGGTFRGADAVIGWFTRELWRWFDEFTSMPEGFIDGGDQIVVPVHVRARAKHGRTVDVHNVWIYELSESKLVRGQVYPDTAVLRDTVEGVTPHAGHAPAPSGFLVGSAIASRATPRRSVLVRLRHRHGGRLFWR